MKNIPYFNLFKNKYFLTKRKIFSLVLENVDSIILESTHIYGTTKC